MSENEGSTKQTASLAIDQNQELRQLLTSFIATSQEDKERQRADVADLRSAIYQLTSKESPLGSIDTPVIDRTGSNRRSSMFFGSPTARDFDTGSGYKTQIQVLQNDIVYEKELKVSSLEGLQYLAKQMQLLASKYPGREIKVITRYMGRYYKQSCGRNS